ncbi:hypothetical protein BaRGS_00025387 [Batillaria attramentaria]|uniref:Uncharacterized protein n=1 Tax=Batillaria attramentaria TaxID=370345 RepID=A0ABD0K8N3_9CAEN
MGWPGLTELTVPLPYCTACSRYTLQHRLSAPLTAATRGWGWGGGGVGGSEGGGLQAGWGEGGRRYCREECYLVGRQSCQYAAGACIGLFDELLSPPSRCHPPPLPQSGTGW